MTTKDKGELISRRDVTTGSVAAGVGILISGAVDRAAAAPRQRRYAIVGVGSRSYMFQEAIYETFAEHAKLVSVCDLNAGRLQLARDFARKHDCPEPKTYKASEFDRLVAETKPEVVIVTTVDGTHDTYINWAMSLGCDVITEKPMTTDAVKCQQIIDARRKFGRKCRVAFNYRYTPVRSQVKELLLGGVIGDVLSVDFSWVLDTNHGADYFRRWHSQKRLSGGLMVHKATHHFDLANWWLSAIPQTVRAQGRREFYTPKMARRLGLKSHHQRCKTCPEKAKCGFELNLADNPRFKSLYLEQEQHDGYFRDQCVFRPDIDIEDTMNVHVTYDSGATLAYTLNAFCGWEGYVVSFNGTKGRLEHKIEERVSLFGDGSTHGALKADGMSIRVFPIRKGAYQIEPRKGEGGHGGGDPLMLADLFLPNPPADKLLRAADERSGAFSILTGVAANRSIASGEIVKISDLVKNIGAPSYPKMPTSSGPVPMPAKI